MKNVCFGLKILHFIHENPFLLELFYKNSVRLTVSLALCVVSSHNFQKSDLTNKNKHLFSLQWKLSPFTTTHMKTQKSFQFKYITEFKRTSYFILLGQHHVLNTMSQLTQEVFDFVSNISILNIFWGGLLCVVMLEINQTSFREGNYHQLLPFYC